MSALVSFDKVSTLIEDLLVFEVCWCDFSRMNSTVTVNLPELAAVQVWTEKLLPLLAAHIAETGDVVASHTVISHGAMVANLLEASSASPHRTQ